jgi:predicted DNA-binding transcriptional regulator YafY
MKREHFDRLATLIRQGEGTISLFMRYEDQKGRETRRVVTPICLGETSRGRLAMLAWCHKRDRMRTFFIENIRNVDPCEYRPVMPDRIVRAMTATKVMQRFRPLP